MSLFPFLAQFGPWNWLILAVILLALEAVLPGVYFAWFGIAAVLVGLIGIVTDLAWQWQLVVFAVLSVASVFVARRLAQSDTAPSDTPDLNARGTQYIGRIVTVEEAIRAGRGRVRVGDTLWTAEGDDEPVGTRVRVIGARDTVLLVERAS
jgi:membrane protein implicated in regulation of membrane protease activity